MLTASDSTVHVAVDMATEIAGSFLPCHRLARDLEHYSLDYERNLLSMLHLAAASQERVFSPRNK